ncbi:MAG: translation initiation factor [Planctomycetota bacterium]
MTRLFAGTPFDIPPTCDDCGESVDDCDCSDSAKAASQAERQRQADRRDPSEQTAVLRREKRKGGRIVTVVSGLSAKANDLPKLLSELQSVCGAGGSIQKKRDQIELQGDHITSIQSQLQSMGFRVRI